MTATRDYPRIIVKLANSNEARHLTIAKIDEALTKSISRDYYGVTELQNILLDLRKHAQGDDEPSERTG
jgi:hypothetical protein